MKAYQVYLCSNVRNTSVIFEEDLLCGLWCSHSLLPLKRILHPLSYKATCSVQMGCSLPWSQSRETAGFIRREWWEWWSVWPWSVCPETCDYLSHQLWWSEPIFCYFCWWFIQGARSQSNLPQKGSEWDAHPLLVFLILAHYSS